MWPATIRRLGPLLPGLVLLLLLWSTAYVSAPPRTFAQPLNPAASAALSAKVADLLAGRSVRLNAAEFAHLVPGAHLLPDGVWVTAGESALGPVYLRVREAQVTGAQLHLYVDASWVGWLPLPPAVLLRWGRDHYPLPASLRVDLAQRAVVLAWPFAPADIEITPNEVVVRWQE